MSEPLFNVSDRPDTDFWRFLRGALWASILVTFVYFISSIIADLIRLRLDKKEKNMPISWPKIILNAISSSIYSFTSSILLYILL